jgi:hypothetical protein
MSTALTLPQPGGSGTKGIKPFSMATWDIRCRRGTGMAAAAKGLAQKGVGIGILTKTKVTNDQYSKSLLAYRVLVLKAASPHQGGIGLIWREDHNGFEVKAVPNLEPIVLPTHHGRQEVLPHGDLHPPPTVQWGWAIFEWHERRALQTAPPL